MSDSADTAGHAANGLYSYKLYAPPLRSDLIGRKSILGRVLRRDPARVMLLQAPAGYGKSTTLRQIMSECDERDFLTAWLTFDEGDNDPRRFLVLFRALLAPVGEKTHSRQPMQPIRATGAIPPTGRLRGSCGAVSGPRFFSTIFRSWRTRRF